jgi:hypothetical protein
LSDAGEGVAAGVAEVSAAVNSPKNNSEKLIEAVGRDSRTKIAVGEHARGEQTHGEQTHGG